MNRRRLGYLATRHIDYREQRLPRRAEDGARELRRQVLDALTGLAVLLERFDRAGGGSPTQRAVRH